MNVKERKGEVYVNTRIEVNSIVEKEKEKEKKEGERRGRIKKDVEYVNPLKQD